ncbi:STAS domain-containing protein [Metabacillus litoralis]|uniref:STAS domain-containing protein n=1 Tax=Metabacillus litoralis TaxID=152268 RepID=A0A5C6W126_9BACI|nr:STAS domain-containing protein [Metabacillus litoralis]TXC89475.1 STAS domain-containing protein [Metabacillus litoralis]
MHRNIELYEFLVENSWQITEQWYQQLDDLDESSVYSTQDTVTINSLKEKNQEFVMQLHKIFNTEEKSFFEKFEEWTVNLAKDQKHLDTDVHYVVREFYRTQDIYLSYIQTFYKQNQDKLEIDQFFTWSNIVRKVFNLSVYIYIDEANKNTLKQIAAQKEMINELSSPVILLQNNVALLPLIGDIDTARAKLILENTLAQSAKLGISNLCIDLSGVAIIDTMVAHEIFNLIKALKLLGVSSTLSGIRPEIAQTAIQLGLDFEEVHTAASLAQALEKITKG